MKRLFILSTLLLVILVGCPKAPDTEIKPTPDPVVPVIDTDWCDEAETNIANLNNGLGCKARDGSDMAEGFTEMCHRVQEEGGIFLNPKCVATAASCDAVKKCSQEGYYQNDTEELKQ
jgi:hypothetical protein